MASIEECFPNTTWEETYTNNKQQQMKEYERKREDSLMDTFNISFDTLTPKYGAIDQDGKRVSRPDTPYAYYIHKPTKDCYIYDGNVWKRESKEKSIWANLFGEEHVINIVNKD